MAKYDIDALRQRIPEERAELFIGFSPWPEDCENWDRSVHEDFLEGPTRRLRRTIWEHPEDRQSRMMIDVLELQSADLAVQALAEALQWNQLAELPEGPPDLGFVSFVHPKGAPPAAFFVQGNLFLSVASVGATLLNVVEWGSRLVRRLLERPKDARDAFRVGTVPSRILVGERMQLSFPSPSGIGEYGFIKLFATGADLIRETPSKLFLIPKTYEVSVDLFVVEPDREPLAGHLSAER